jgi:hypothetical protein
LPDQTHSSCINCKESANANRICTFALTYFIGTDQSGDYIDCPADSATNDWNTVEDAMVHFYEYPESYMYPYCKTNVTYYAQHTSNTTVPTRDYLEEPACGTYEYLTRDYDQCKLVYPGMYAVSSSDEEGYDDCAECGFGPTESVVQGLYTQLYRGESGPTEIIEKECPVDTASLIMAGAVNAKQGCRLHEAGNCTDVDYCQDGSEFTCPKGMKLVDTPDSKGIANCKICE